MQNIFLDSRDVLNDIINKKNGVTTNPSVILGDFCIGQEEMLTDISRNQNKNSSLGLSQWASVSAMNSTAESGKIFLLFLLVKFYF